MIKKLFTLFWEQNLYGDVFFNKMGFNLIMISAIKKMHFKPAEFEGNPISVKYKLPVQFKF